MTSSKWIRIGTLTLLLVLPAIVLAIKIFSVDFFRDLTPTGAFVTAGRVNQVPEILAWAKLPVNNRKFVKIIYKNGATERYFVWDWRASAPLEIVPGTYEPRAPGGTGNGDVSCGGERSCPNAAPERSSPLIVDLEDNGLELSVRGEGVLFDIRATGEPIATQWVRAMGDEAFLVRDLNGNAAIDDGSELFGEGTVIEIEGRNAVNGFEALAQYDLVAFGGNGDGRISRRDNIWPELFLWLDRDADGESSPSEFLSLRSQGIQALSLKTRRSRRTDAAGNSFELWSWAVGRNESGTRETKRLVDVFFRAL